MISARTPSPDEVYEQVARVWSFAGPLPLPREESYLGCSTCPTGAELIVRSWRYFARGGDATCPYRCDVATKCSVCGALTWFGVVVPPEAWARVPSRFVTLTIKRKEAIAKGWLDPFPTCGECGEPDLGDEVSAREHAACRGVPPGQQSLFDLSEQR